MATESKSGAESDLPFKDPLQVRSNQAETIKMASDDPAEISLQSGEDDLRPATQSSLDELMVYLQKGLNSLKGLNLNGFQQIYPIFLSILGAVIAALILVIVTNILNSINHLPLIGHLLGCVHLVLPVDLATSHPGESRPGNSRQYVPYVANPWLP